MILNRHARFVLFSATQDEQDSIHRTVSAVVLFGNMQFKQERNSDQATLPDNTGASALQPH